MEPELQNLDDSLPPVLDLRPLLRGECLDPETEAALKRIVESGRPAECLTVRSYHPESPGNLIRGDVIVLDGERLTVERVDFRYNAPTGGTDPTHVGVYFVYTTDGRRHTLRGDQAVAVED